MSADIRIDGSGLDASGRQLWATGVSVTEEATGVSLGSTLGGVGSLQVVTDSVDSPMAVQGKKLEIDFGDGGVAGGAITTVSATNGLTTLTALSALAPLNRTVSVAATSTTLGDHLRAIFAACGITADKYAIDATVSARTMVLPGWTANAWQMLKELAVVEQFELADVSGTITVRRIGEIKMDIIGHHGMTESTSEGQLGLFVETYFYPCKTAANAPVYPPAVYDTTYGGTTAPGWQGDADVIEVSPGSPVVLEVPMMASLTSVVQPVCKDYVSRSDTGSVYCITMSDGVRPVNAATWTARGGKVTVTIMPDTQTLKIVIDAGANDPAGAPYRLMVDDGKTEWSTLRIIGTGIFWSKERIRQRTSIPDADTANEIASSTDSIYVRTEAQAYKNLRGQAAQVSRAITSLSGSLVPSLPVGQRAGAIVAGDRANYRLRSVASTGLDATISGDRHTTVAEHNASLAGKTVAQASAVWAGETVAAHITTPLAPRV